MLLVVLCLLEYTQTYCSRPEVSAISATVKIPYKITKYLPSPAQGKRQHDAKPQRLYSLVLYPYLPK